MVTATLTTLSEALKEWAVTVRALDEGKQTILIRKGGIREVGKEFRVEYDRFVLYPTYEHQKAHLVKEEYQTELQATYEDVVKDDKAFRVTHWCSVEEIHQVMEEERLAPILPYQIFTADYAKERLHWRPKKPLYVLTVRAYRLERPVTIPVRAEYAGCTSWVPLGVDVPLGSYTPVLSDAEFAAQRDLVRRLLSGGTVK